MSDISMENQNWTYNEFLTFLLIYVANVDMEFAEEEKRMIQKVDGMETYQKMVDLFDSMSDYKAYETILAYKDTYYPTAVEKDRIMENMKDLFYADADFNIMEKELLHFLERMM